MTDEGKVVLSELGSLSDNFESDPTHVFEGQRRREKLEEHHERGRFVMRIGTSDVFVPRQRK